MICPACREPHAAAACIDTIAGREYPWRHCVCQHKPRTDRTEQTEQKGQPDGEDPTVVPGSTA